MSRYSPFHPNSETTLEAASEWRDRCLKRDGSLFGPDLLWSHEGLTEVAQRFSGAVEGGGGGFYEKLTQQFEGASPNACKLLSEILWILYLFPNNMGPRSKREGIGNVWAWSGAPLEGEQAERLLSDDVLKGLGSGGPGFMNHRPRELGFLIRAMTSFKSFSPEMQLSLLNDGWAFATWLDELPDAGRRQLKLMLPHLLFPDTFERFSSAGQVGQVLETLGNLPRTTVNQMTKIEQDRELARVRQELEESRGELIDFYQPDVKDVWDPAKEIADVSTPASVGIHDSAGAEEISSSMPLNQILYGPPGTGKTFQVVDRAIAILDPNFLVRSEGHRKGLKDRFDELVDEGSIRFVTFHQSFSYEEFIEGLRAETTEAGSVRYVVRDGILKSFCESSVRPFKLGEQFSSGYVVSRCTPEILWLDKPNGSQLPFPWKVLDELADAVRHGKLTVQDIRDKKVFDLIPDCRLEKFLVNGYNNIIPVLVERLLERPSSISDVLRKRVLIIDEINRGNISKILGETITLIEPSKRLGSKEALTTILPYSKTTFGVPVGLHIIGTMNTADRSLASIDMALRRRFVFEEIEPQTTQLEGVEIAGVDLAQLLSVMNARIEALLDRDHRLGHAYFLNLQASDDIDQLKELFSRRIVPLLKEYFFDDWRRIRLVLNDQRKNDPRDQFVVEGPHDAAALFGPEQHGVAINGTWRINATAFDRPEAYRQIIGGQNADH